jgi:competence/damage-inducible protein CinA-like protein
MPPRAEILTIGTELLLGEILDRNSQFLAQGFRDLGIDLFRITTVGDNVERIAQAIREATQRAEILLTTGGLGPTVDDPTRAAVAQAFGLVGEFHPELWEQIEQRFARYGRRPTENNRLQAYLPSGALPLENRVGTAPAFIVERGDRSIICLPGVPAEMKALWGESVVPYLRRRYPTHRVILRRVLHSAGVGESWLDERIQDLERLSNPTVGLAAHPGQVDIRITASAKSVQEAQKAIGRVEAELRRRLVDLIYGADEETLMSAVGRLLGERSWRLVSAESGTSGGIAAALSGQVDVFAAGMVLPDGAELTDVVSAMRDLLAEHQAQAGMAISLTSQGDRLQLAFAMDLPAGGVQEQAAYGGAVQNASRWATTLALNRLRLALQDQAKASQ